MTRSAPRLTTIVLAAAATALVAACGSSGGTAAGPAASAKGNGSADVSYAQQQLAKYAAIPTFKASGSAFDVSSLRGKSMFVIPAASNDFDNTIEAQMKQIAARHGVKYTEFSNQGSPAEWVAGFNAALNAKPDLIVLNTALNPSQVKAQMQSAKAAHIPVIATHFFDKDYSKSLNTPCGGPAELCAAGLTATVNAPFNAATRVEADHIIADSKAEGHVLLISASDAAPSDGMVAAAKSEFADHCGSCSLQVLNLSIADWSTKIQPAVQAALLRDPKIAYIVPIFDFGASFAASGINAAGKAATVKIVSYNGTQSVLTMLQKSGPVQMDVGEPLNWLGYAFMDQSFRVMAGQAPVEQNTPIRVFTKANIAETGTPPDVAKGYGDAFIQGYQSLWTSKG